MRIRIATGSRFPMATASMISMALIYILPPISANALPTPVLEFLFNETGTAANNNVAPPISGDYNADGNVDASDYVLWRKNAGSAEEYETWQANFGQQGSGTTSLPMKQWDGTTWVSADNHGPDSGGVSGQPGDRSYYDPSIVLDPNQAPGTSNSHYFGGFAGGLNVPEAQDMTALTVQGWFKPPAGKKIGESPGSYSPLVGNISHYNTDGGWVVRTIYEAHAGRIEFYSGQDDFTQNHFTFRSDPDAYFETDQWVFFAVTLDPVLGDVQFFKGTSDLAVESAGFTTSGGFVNGVIKASDRNFYIGNSGAESLAWFQGRAFDGQLDNIRVFENVLSIDELEQLRQTDLAGPGLASANSQGVVPEPSSLLLCGILFALTGSVRRHRKP